MTDADDLAKRMRERIASPMHAHRNLIRAALPYVDAAADVAGLVDAVRWVLNDAACNAPETLSRLERRWLNKLSDAYFAAPSLRRDVREEKP